MIASRAQETLEERLVAIGLDACSCRTPREPGQANRRAGPVGVAAAGSFPVETHQSPSFAFGRHVDAAGLWVASETFGREEF